MSRNKTSKTQQVDFLADDGRPDFTKLFSEARPQLLAIARRIVRSESEAEDIVQQAFLNAIKARDTFEGRARATSWMYRITYNTALMSLRSKRRRPAESLEALEEIAGEVFCESPDPQPGEEVARGRLRGLLGNALSALNPVDQKIVAMRLHDGYSTTEVAETMGLTESATKTRLHRARRALRDELAFA